MSSKYDDSHSVGPLQTDMIGLPTKVGLCIFVRV